MKFRLDNSDKTFGIFFSIIFFIISIYPIFYKNQLNYIFLLFSFIFLLVSLTRPKLFSFLNKLWINLGFLLGKIISPIVMAIIFFFLITPIGLLLRIFGKDFIKLKLNNNHKTYWIDKDNESSDMKDQF
tara:strand:+ start:2123 stop:2509 length:387 start_codon:yes stop_codon:yes gene_type:complete